MIGLVFKLGFVPIFFFLFPVLVPCSPFRVLVTSIFSQSEQTFVRHIVSRPIGTGFFTCDLVNKCIMPSFPLKTYRDLGAVGEGGGGLADRRLIIYKQSEDHHVGYTEFS